MIKDTLFTPKDEKDIVSMLNRGSTIELKKVNGQIQVIEIQRKVKIKTSITG